MSDEKANTKASVTRPDEWRDAAERLRKEEDALLKANGFQSAESDLLWVKECCCYGREAALQRAFLTRTNPKSRVSK